MPKKIDLYHQLLDLVFTLSQAVKKGPVNVDSTANGVYTNESTDIDDYYLKDAVAIVDLKLFNGLTAHACKYLLGLMEQMKMNNIFYIHKDPNANERRSLAELKKHGILFPTEKVGLYIINPVKLRRGKPMATIMASLHHYHKDNSVFRITNLRPPKRALLGV